MRILEVGQRCKYRIMANKGETGKTVGGFEAVIQLIPSRKQEKLNHQLTGARVGES